MQEIPIPDATFLDGDANTFPGKEIFVLFCVYARALLTNTL